MQPHSVHVPRQLRAPPVDLGFVPDRPALVVTGPNVAEEAHIQLETVLIEKLLLFGPWLVAQLGIVGHQRQVSYTVDQSGDPARVLFASVKVQGLPPVSLPALRSDMLDRDLAEPELVGPVLVLPVHLLRNLAKQQPKAPLPDPVVHVGGSEMRDHFAIARPPVPSANRHQPPTDNRGDVLISFVRLPNRLNKTERDAVKVPILGLERDASHQIAVDDSTCRTPAVPFRACRQGS